MLKMIKNKITLLIGSFRSKKSKFDPDEANKQRLLKAMTMPAREILRTDPFVVAEFTRAISKQPPEEVSLNPEWNRITLELSEEHLTCDNPQKASFYYQRSQPPSEIKRLSAKRIIEVFPNIVSVLSELPDETVLRPEWSRTCFVLGEHYLKSGDKIQASVFYRKISEKSAFAKKALEFFYNCGQSAHKDDHNCEEAVFHYEQILLRKSAPVAFLNKALFELGNINLFELNRPDLAYDCFNQLAQSGDVELVKNANVLRQMALNKLNNNPAGITLGMLESIKNNNDFNLIHEEKTMQSYMQQKYPLNRGQVFLPKNNVIKIQEQYDLGLLSELQDMKEMTENNLYLGVATDFETGKKKIIYKTVNLKINEYIKEGDNDLDEDTINRIINVIEEEKVSKISKEDKKSLLKITSKRGHTSSDSSLSEFHKQLQEIVTQSFKELGKKEDTFFKKTWELRNSDLNNLQKALVFQENCGEYNSDESILLKCKEIVERETKSWWPSAFTNSIVAMQFLLTDVAKKRIAINLKMEEVMVIGGFIKNRSFEDQIKKDNEIILDEKADKEELNLNEDKGKIKNLEIENKKLKNQMSELQNKMDEILKNINKNKPQPEITISPKTVEPVSQINLQNEIQEQIQTNQKNEIVAPRGTSINSLESLETVSQNIILSRTASTRPYSKDSPEYEKKLADMAYKKAKTDYTNYKNSKEEGKENTLSKIIATFGIAKKHYKSLLNETKETNDKIVSRINKIGQEDGKYSKNSILNQMKI